MGSVTCRFCLIHKKDTFTIRFLKRGIQSVLFEKITPFIHPSRHIDIDGLADTCSYNLSGIGRHVLDISYDIGIKK